VHGGGAVAAGLLPEALDSGADEDAGDLAAERRRLREHGERALLDLVAVMLEEDQRGQSSLFSARNSTIF
jgi:hypothetical protein